MNLVFLSQLHLFSWFLHRVREWCGNVPLTANLSSDSSHTDVFDRINYLSEVQIHNHWSPYSACRCSTAVWGRSPHCRPSSGCTDNTIALAMVGPWNGWQSCARSVCECARWHVLYVDRPFRCVWTELLRVLSKLGWARNFPIGISSHEFSSFSFSESWARMCVDLWWLLLQVMCVFMCVFKTEGNERCVASNLALCTQLSSWTPVFLVIPPVFFFFLPVLLLQWLQLIIQWTSSNLPECFTSFHNSVGSNPYNKSITP